MDVFLFDLLPYSKNIEAFRVGGAMPRLGRSYFEPEIAVQTYAEHLDAWVELERLGYDGVSVNEHHGTPYGLMNSPNLLVASIAQRTKRLKLLTYGNLLPIHEPLRLAEELAMLDCLSNGRLIAGVARGAPREYRVYNVSAAESRERFEECFEIMRRAWTEESFSFEGKFHAYKDVAIWPRPVQAPHPPVWVPVTGSKETIEWAASHDIAITPGVTRQGTAREDIVRHYAKSQAKFGRKVTPGHLNLMIDCYVADSKAQAIKEYGPYFIYFWNTLIRYDHEAQDTQKGYYSASAHQYLRSGTTGTLASDKDRPLGNAMTMDSLARQAEGMAWGTPDEVATRIIDEADEAGAHTVLLICNRGALPQELFLNQIRRIGAEVLPRLKAHKITRVKFAEGAAG
jgi:alkanesulfonate monooxygenase SsuD/methylene tetrahydromethanopterin reductase-like flavin-dependent oxidoreductase (luciferase family)